jgi:membrane protein
MAGVPPIGELAREAYAGYRRHLDLQLAAALAFFASLALPPLAALALAGAERVFGREEVRAFAYNRVAAAVGPDVARLIAGAVEGYAVGRGSLPAVLGTIGLFVASAGLIYQAQLALRHVFEFEKPSDLKRVLRLRGVGLAAIAALVGLVMALFAALAVLSAVEILGSVSNATTTFAVALVALAATSLSYRWLSGRTIPWGAAIGGGVVATLSLLVGRSLFAIYIGVADVGSAYGSFAAVFVLLMWLYAISAVYLIGAEVARAWMALGDPPR